MDEPITKKQNFESRGEQQKIGKERSEAAVYYLEGIVCMSFEN